MNVLNYASLEPCQRLQAAGIVLETDAVWLHVKGGSWHLVPRDNRVISDEIDKIVPAPSMAEVWRELPEEIEWEKAYLQCGKTVQGENYSGYVRREEDCFEEEIYIVENTNLVDALIDLLIWVTKQRKEKKDERNRNKNCRA